MSSNAMWTLITITVANLIGGGIWLGTNGCVRHERVVAGQRTVEAALRTAAAMDAHRADVARAEQLRANAHELRLRWVTSCRVTPDEAERLLPPMEAP